MEDPKLVSYLFWLTSTIGLFVYCIELDGRPDPQALSRRDAFLVSLPSKHANSRQPGRRPRSTCKSHPNTDCMLRERIAGHPCR